MISILCLYQSYYSYSIPKKTHKIHWELSLTTKSSCQAGGYDDSSAPNAPQATDDKTSWLGDVGIAQWVPKKKRF